MRVQLVEQLIMALEHEQRLLRTGNDKEYLLLEHFSSDWQDITALAEEENCLGLVDLFGFYGELRERFLADKETLSDDDSVFLQQANALIKTFLQTASIAGMMAVLDMLQNPLWVSPIDAEDIAYLKDFLETDRQLLALSESGSGQNAAPSHEMSGDEDSFCRIDTALLIAEGVAVDIRLIAMIAEQCNLLHEQWLAPGPDNLPALIGQSLEALEPIVRAIESIQLRACYLTLSGLIKNLHCYHEDLDLVTDETRDLLGQVIATINQYFQDVTDPVVYASLISIFENPEWPYCLSEEQGSLLGKLFAQVRVDPKQAIVAELVIADEVSLDIPHDVDPQILDMVFNELPQLTEEFAKVLHQFLNTNDRVALRSAQRVAHTLKGLANMLGVKGIANMTHRLEDILEFLHEQSKLPDSTLTEALIEATDCLAGMSEAVLNRTSAQPMSLVILQQLADEHYRLQTDEHLDGLLEPVTAIDTGTESAASLAQDGQQTEQDTDITGREDAFVRVPKQLLDHLFRVAGEVKIQDAQLDAQLRQSKNLLKTGSERYRTLQYIIGDLEQLMESSLINAGVTTTSERFDPLELNRLNEMHSIISRLYEAIADSREIEHTVENNTREMHDTVINLTHLHKENLDNVLATRLLAVESMEPRLQRTLRQACRVTGKKAQLTVNGLDTLIDSQILNQLADPLMHIIRNAVDHGLEAVEQRIQAGKPESGQVTLSFFEETDMIVVSCEDDGRGINREAIKQIALGKGLIDAAASLTDQDIDRLILIPGFSTTKTVSQLSGRGIGLDVVYQEIIRLKGKLEIHSKTGQGCRFTLSIPSSSLLLKANLVQCGEHILSIIQYGIEHILLSRTGAFQEIDEELWFYYQGERFKAYALESLMGIPETEPQKKFESHVLLVNLDQGEKAAVMVGNLLDNRELVFKDMGRYVPHNPVIPGVTILPNGEVSAVIDLPEALRHKSAYNRRVMDYVAQTAINKLPRILIVDDSLSARKSLAILLKDSGYDVVTAIDGLDALNQIELAPPDLLITDMEMPRMNGVELTASLKKQNHTAKLPVLMITSRSTGKHRDEASLAGVDAYLTKPWSETELLQQIEALL